MQRLTENKIVLITRKTRLDDLVARFNTVMQAKFYIEHMGSDFHDYQSEHDNYYKAVDSVLEKLTTMGRIQQIDRAFLPNFVFGADDIVVAVGQDGLVANSLKYLNEQPLIGINPDPERWDGVLLPFSVSDVTKIIPEVFQKKRTTRSITMGKVVLNDGQSLLAVNDFYIGQRTHVSSRYIITVGEQSERHSSSGIIVSTGLGSSGWLKSVLAGAKGISGMMQTLDNDAKKIIRKTNSTQSFDMAWDADYLRFSVREPFPSKSTQANMVFGVVRDELPLKILSLMGENGVIFSDGVEQDYLSFNSGLEATIRLAAHKGRLVV